ncbi:ABC transporter permease [candidate division KSB3 bacterium]|uniref:Transport permease protein n=1 Tax=candidate division KSB3 bacterium TaxID=2044937 RepID=A0A9D5JYK9_9BACT|nr:ABC transporter permease [candidate division KSB3 bacterium]MBD3326126.1 ABC transporter permease [candidate division KSB3 bacterium]
MSEKTLQEWRRRNFITYVGEGYTVYLFRLKELYRYRSLIWNLVIRELKARYRGSLLGFLWSFLNPLLLMSVYALVFAVYLRFGMESYVVFLISGLLPWLWFSSSLLGASGAILSGGNLIKKILFPAEVLPLVVVLSNGVNFLLSLPILLLFVFLFKTSLGVSIVTLPVVIAIQMVFTVGLSFLFSALCVHYRDIQHVLGNFLTLWFFVTPIIYPLSNIPEKFQFTVSLNPVAPLIFAYQDIFYYGRFPNFSQLFMVAVMAIVVYTMGSAVFEKYRGTFAEEV